MEGGLPKQAIVVAGGDKTVFANITNTDKGKSLLQKNVELLAESGIDKILIVSSHPEAVENHIGSAELFDCEVVYIKEKEPSGNAGALHYAKSYVQGDAIVTYATAFKDVNIQDMYQYHKRNGGAITIALTTTPRPEHYGVALLNGPRIVTFVEKPDKENAPSNLISAGLFIATPEVFDMLPSGYAKMETDVFPRLAAEDKMYGYVFPGAYEDTKR